jgi:hypothetical protein
MADRMLRRTAALAMSVMVATMSGCAASISDETAAGAGGGDAAPLGPSKARWSFELPSQGTPNDNGDIGPFCCTGVTAVVNDQGHDLGYGYFFSWKGQAYTNGTDSWMPDFTLGVAGVQDLDDPSSPLRMSEIDFDAGHIAEGMKKSTTAGDLVFTVTVEHVDETPAPMIQMGTLAVRLDVDPLD